VWRPTWPPYFKVFDSNGSSKPCSLLAMKGRLAGNKLGILKEIEHRTTGTASEEVIAAAVLMA